MHRVTQDKCDSPAKKTDNAKASTSWCKSTDIVKTRPPWLMYRKYQSVSGARGICNWEHHALAQFRRRAVLLSTVSN